MLLDMLQEGAAAVAVGPALQTAADLAGSVNPARLASNQDVADQARRDEEHRELEVQQALALVPSIIEAVDMGQVYCYHLASLACGSNCSVLAMC